MTQAREKIREPSGGQVTGDKCSADDARRRRVTLPPVLRDLSLVTCDSLGRIGFGFWFPAEHGLAGGGGFIKSSNARGVGCIED